MPFQPSETLMLLLGRNLVSFLTCFPTSFLTWLESFISAKRDVIFLHKPVHILRLCIALFCYSLLKNDISKLTDTRFSKDVKKHVGKDVGKDVRKDVGKHVKKLTRFRPNKGITQFVSPWQRPMFSWCGRHFPKKVFFDGHFPTLGFARIFSESIWRHFPKKSAWLGTFSEKMYCSWSYLKA